MHFLSATKSTGHIPAAAPEILLVHHKHWGAELGGNIGKAHPADNIGKSLIQEMVQFSDQEDVRGKLVFLPDYDMSLARPLYPGCDVWVNNPLRPYEACGTSGMKAALNGAANLSIRDGWWDELYSPEFGWEIPSAEGMGLL